MGIFSTEMAQSDAFLKFLAGGSISMRQNYGKMEQEKGHLSETSLNYPGEHFDLELRQWSRGSRKYFLAIETTYTC